MLTVTQALIDYWRRLPASPHGARRGRLDAAIERVRAGAERREVLLPFAIGDVDDEIVASATRTYVCAAGAAPSDQSTAVHDAIEWIRRGLALNRGAVFAALLALEDEAILARLAQLRLGLTAGEVATACRNLAPRPAGPLAAFLHDWLQLLDGQALHAERRSLGAALDGACAQAA